MYTGVLSDSVGGTACLDVLQKFHPTCVQNAFGCRVFLLPGQCGCKLHVTKCLSNHPRIPKAETIDMCFHNCLLVVQHPSRTAPALPMNYTDLEPSSCEESSRVESSLYAKTMAGPSGHRREKEMNFNMYKKFPLNAGKS